MYVARNEIICRQRGTKWHAGKNVHLGRDFTVNASVDGWVKFETDYDNRKTFIHVVPEIKPDLKVPVAHLIDYSVAMMSTIKNA